MVTKCNNLDTRLAAETGGTARREYPLALKTHDKANSPWVMRPPR
jgi:hypothetical protein